MKILKAFPLVAAAASVFAQPAYAPFINGVASGDPLSDRVMLWTRVTADSSQTVTVNWRIASDSSFNAVINSGSFTTDSSRDFTVKVDATGLQPNTTYYYDFETGGNYSAIGRTRTLPDGDVEHVRLAVVTCAKYSKGYFNAYARVGDRNDINAVVHLGDYIYESRDSGEVGRPMNPYARCSTLVQFRTRYEQYHHDPDLLWVRQRHPFINVWDDHETANDCWQHGSENFPDSTQFAAIKQAATKAYFEWIPIRENTARPGSIYRSFRFGDLIDLIMLDTRREGRMQQLLFESANMPAINDSIRTILGHAQFSWLMQQLDGSTARWRIIGQQVMMAPALLFGNPLNEDQWDGYPAERNKIYDHMEHAQMNNVVVLTGDLHAALANDLPKIPSQYDDATGAGSVAVEFITPAIASSKSSFSGFPVSTIKLNDPHIQYAEFDKNGYLLLDVTDERTQGDFYFVATTDYSDSSEQLGASYYTLHGTKHFYREPSGLTEQTYSPPLIRIFPNPTADFITAEIVNSPFAEIQLVVTDLCGREVKRINDVSGESRVRIEVRELENGVYFLKGMMKSQEFYSAKFIIIR